MVGTLRGGGGPEPLRKKIPEPHETQEKTRNIFAKYLKILIIKFKFADLHF